MSYTNGLDKPSDYFNTVLYTGNNTDNTSISGLDFQPDWVWLKARNQADYHYSMDSVRGALKPLFQNDTSAEANFSDSLKSFNTDGFTLGTSGDLNAASQTMVAWNWKAGTSFTNDASSTGIGSIDSTGSVSTDAGFSIVKYNSSRSPSPVQTVAHGLGVKPDMLIFKNIDETQNWLVWNKTLATNKHLNLNTTSALSTDAGSLNNTAPTSTVFTIGADGRTNSTTNGNPIICYAFAEKKGYSKFGSYVGNGGGAANGNFIYTGFSPAFVMIKNTTHTYNWVIQDNKRNTFNPLDRYIYPNTSGAEAQNSIYDLDLLSNGFKVRSQRSETNDTNNGYIFMCFAENPFVTSTGVPATAR